MMMGKHGIYSVENKFVPGRWKNARTLRRRDAKEAKALARKQKKQEAKS